MSLPLSHLKQITLTFNLQRKRNGPTLLAGWLTADARGWRLSLCRARFTKWCRATFGATPDYDYPVKLTLVRSKKGRFVSPGPEQHCLVENRASGKSTSWYELTVATRQFLQRFVGFCKSFDVYVTAHWKE